MQGPLWSQPEADHLLDLVGDLPWPLLVQRYNHWARSNGYPQRSSTALTVKSQRLGAARVPVGRWITLCLIHPTLGISHNCPQRWVRKWPHILQPFQPNDDTNGRIYIRRDNLRRFARLQPEQFGGISVSRLVMLLEDERLAEWIAENYPSRPAGLEERRIPCRPVRCVETGQTFPSIQAAAKAVHITKYAISVALKRGGRSAGYRWEDAREVAA